MGGEAVQDRDPGLKFGGLVVEVAGHDALAEKLLAAHLGLDQTSLVIADPAFPDGSAKEATTSRGDIVCDGTGRPFFPGLAVFAG